MLLTTKPCQIKPPAHAHSWTLHLRARASAPEKGTETPDIATLLRLQHDIDILNYRTNPFMFHHRAEKIGNNIGTMAADRVCHSEY